MMHACRHGYISVNFAEAALFCHASRIFAANIFSLVFLFVLYLNMRLAFNLILIASICAANGKKFALAFFTI